MNVEFNPFPKMARLSRECIVTEKLDGTNAQIYIDDENNILAGSRNRWVTPEDDNFGFAGWVRDNSEELISGLGPGRHFGEWWGGKIQRGYGIEEKRFSLFNTTRWVSPGTEPGVVSVSDKRIVKYQETAPECCHIVPILYKGVFDTQVADDVLDNLNRFGSIAAPGFDNPEGIIVFHAAANIGFKKTIDKDEMPKGKLKK